MYQLWPEVRHQYECERFHVVRVGPDGQKRDEAARGSDGLRRISR